MNLQGTPAIVTGGGSGMGEAAARALAKAGAKVAVLDLNKSAAEKIARDIGGVAFECDVSSAASAEAAVADAAAAHGPARILVNCAGILVGKRIVGKEGAADLEHFQKVLAVNLSGTFNLTRLVAAGASKLEPLTPSGERGVIINTASVAAFEGQVGQAAYSASKGGIVSLTLPAARELAAFGIRVLCIAPGIVATPMILNLPKEAQESLVAPIPFPKRLTQPEEFAALVMHMIGNEALNGEVVRLDGAVRLAAKM